MSGSFDFHKWNAKVAHQSSLHLIVPKIDLTFTEEYSYVVLMGSALSTEHFLKQFTHLYFFKHLCCIDRKATCRNKEKVS